MFTNTIYKSWARPRPSGDAPVVVIPGQVRYAEQMERCHQLAYGYSAAEAVDCPECLTADKFRQHLRIFPEGQYLALEVASDKVVGTTSNMRIQYDLSRPANKSWAELTADG